MSGRDSRLDPARGELAGWFADQSPETGWRVPVEAAIATTDGLPQRRGFLPVPALPRARLAWAPAAVLALVAGVVALSVGLGLADLAHVAAPPTPSAPGGVGASPVASPTAVPSGARLFWANNGLSTIGSATLDGGWIDENLIRGASFPCGVAVDALHVYWANAGDGSIGRANLDGTGIDEHFITGATSPCGVAVDAGHVYWANGGAFLVDAPSAYLPAGVPKMTSATTIGRANLDGSNVEQAFIRGASLPCGVAVDGAHIYWANSTMDDTGKTAVGIGRANLDGTGVDQRFIDRARTTWSCGIAVDAGHVYWASSSYGIGRAALDGSASQPAWLASNDGPCGVAADDAHLYWASNGLLGVGRANLDGSGADASFVGTGNVLGYPYACGVAVTP